MSDVKHGCCRKVWRFLKEMTLFAIGVKSSAEALVDECFDFPDTPWGRSERAYKIRKVNEAIAKQYL